MVVTAIVENIINDHAIALLLCMQCRPLSLKMTLNVFIHYYPVSVTCVINDKIVFFKLIIKLNLLGNLKSRLK